MSVLEGLTLEEKSRLLAELQAAGPALAELQQQQAEIARQERTQAEAERLTAELESVLAEFVVKRNEVGANLQTWLDQGIQMAVEIERLNREANAVFRFALAQAQAAVTAGVTGPPVLPGDYSGIAQDEIRKRTGSPYLMNLLPKPDHPAAQQVAQALAGYCSDRRFGFGFTGTQLLPIWQNVIEKS